MEKSANMLHPFIFIVSDFSQITTVSANMGKLKNKWMHIHRMDRSSLMQAVTKYQAAANRQPGCQLRGFQDVTLKPEWATVPKSLNM
jgi:hypothetical protein